MLDDTGKQSAFRGYLDVSGSLDAFLMEVLIPMRIIRNDASLASGQNLNDWLRQLMRFPIGDGVAVDHVICASGPEQSQEVSSALFPRAFKPGEPLVAIMGAVTVLALTACSRVVHVDIGGDLKGCCKKVILLLVKIPFVLSQDTVRVAG